MGTDKECTYASDPQDTVFVGLPAAGVKWSEQLLRTYFEASFGTVTKINMFWGPMGPINGGFAYVTFNDVSTTVSILSHLGGHMVLGALMEVKERRKPVVSKKKGKNRRSNKPKGPAFTTPKPRAKVPYAHPCLCPVFELTPASPVFVPSQVIAKRSEPQNNSRPQSTNQTNNTAEIRLKPRSKGALASACPASPLSVTEIRLKPSSKDALASDCPASPLSVADIRLKPRSKDTLASDCPASPLSPAHRCIGSPLLARRSMNAPQSNNGFASPLSGLRRSLPVNQNVPTQEKSFAELGGTTSKNPGAAMSKFKQLAAKQATRPQSNDKPFSGGESHNSLRFLGQDMAFDDKTCVDSWASTAPWPSVASAAALVRTPPVMHRNLVGAGSA
jgi:hypothetical protein